MGVGLNLNFEFAHKLLMNFNSTFAKSMNLNLNFDFSKSMNLNLVFLKSMNLNLIFSKSMDLNLNVKIKKKMNGSNPGYNSFSCLSDLCNSIPRSLIMIDCTFFLNVCACAKCRAAFLPVCSGNVEFPQNDFV